MGLHIHLDAAIYCPTVKKDVILNPGTLNDRSPSLSTLAQLLGFCFISPLTCVALMSLTALGHICSYQFTDHLQALLHIQSNHRWSSIILDRCCSVGVHTSGCNSTIVPQGPRSQTEALQWVSSSSSAFASKPPSASWMLLLWQDYRQVL
jgi:hypothetical protein